MNTIFAERYSFQCSQSKLGSLLVCFCVVVLFVCCCWRCCSLKFEVVVLAFRRAA